jgi:hypothetical protein
MSKFKGEEDCRLKVGLRQCEDFRWYVVMAIWKNGAATGPPFKELMGPTGGFETEEEALALYHEKVKPITDQMIADAEADGVDVERKISTLLH